MARSSVNYINVLNTLTGIQPVFDRRTLDGHKFSKIGLFFTVIHLSIAVLIEVRQRQQLSGIAVTVGNVNYVMMFAKRMLNLFFPFILCLGTIYQFEAFDKLSRKLDKFDYYLKQNRLDTHSLELHEKKYSIFAIILVPFIMIACAVMVYLCINKFTMYELHHLYLEVLYLEIFHHTHLALMYLKTWQYFNGIILRQDMLLSLLGELRLRNGPGLIDTTTPRYRWKLGH